LVIGMEFGGSPPFFERLLEIREGSLVKRLKQKEGVRGTRREKRKALSLQTGGFCTGGGGERQRRKKSYRGEIGNYLEGEKRGKEVVQLWINGRGNRRNPKGKRTFLSRKEDSDFRKAFYNLIKDKKGGSRKGGPAFTMRGEGGG